MGGPKRRGAVFGRGRDWKRRSRSVPDHGGLFCSPPPGRGSLPLSGRGSPRRPRIFGPIRASLSQGFCTKEDRRRRRGVVRCRARVTARPREPCPADAARPIGRRPMRRKRVENRKFILIRHEWARRADVGPIGSTGPPSALDRGPRPSHNVSQTFCTPGDQLFQSRQSIEALAPKKLHSVWPHRGGWHDRSFMVVS
jgi:hypothetical protein